MTLRIAAIAAAIILAFIVSSASASTTVSVVYFYPKDQTPVQASIDAIDPLVTDMRAWYGEQVTYTFDSEAVEVVEGERRLSRYEGDFWSIILRELGYFCDTGIHLIIIHDSIDSDYRGAGNCGIDGGGTAMLSERMLDWSWGPGAIPHEMGHTFTLPHPAGCGEPGEPSYCDDTIMWAWWEYPDVGLLDYEVDILLTHPQFNIDVLDSDGDGWLDSTEVIIGTDPFLACGTDAWPVDFNSDTFVTSGDLSEVAARIGQSVPPAPARVDIDPRLSPSDQSITSGDLSQVASLIGQGCTP